MSQSKLFDYNSSFSVIRTNPKLTGNFKISVDSSGGVWFNSMNVNETLSNDRFKKYNITGQNSYAKDVCDFFASGNISNDLIFQVGKFTSGEKQSAQEYAGQYDFFYAQGAQSLIDKNYPEDFSYFAPLWIKNEIPDFFVIFKLDGPLDYPYSTNADTIESGIKYKVIQDFESTENFKISYGKDPSGQDIFYTDGQFFTGNSNFGSYSVISGSGKVAVYDELKYYNDVNDISGTFKSKFLNNATAIKTFDLRRGTKIGDYIRNIFNNPGFSKSPLEVSWGYNSYSYFKGISVSEGIYTSKGELLNEYLCSSKSDPMIDLEDYITSGFSRNGIICPNLLNLEFYFNDDDSKLYTINRYAGFYVSRNDIAQLRLNGDFFYEYRNLDGNENTPIPTRNNVGYYYNNTPYEIGATSGIRLFYEQASGFLPGSDNINLLNPEKLFYLTDKKENFYSLKRTASYGTYGGDLPKYSYGPYDYTSGSFSATGSTGATAGSLVIQNTITDLLNFTGSDDKLISVNGQLAKEAGRSYIQIEFLKSYSDNTPLTFKFYWPNGSQTDGSRKYDLIRSADLSALLPWVDGSYYADGNTYYFNAESASTESIASAFCGTLNSLDESLINTAPNLSSSVTRVKNPGTYGNENFSFSVFDDYDTFVSAYSGNFNNTGTYATGSIVNYSNSYYISNQLVSPISQFNDSPDESLSWNPYYTFGATGYVKINGVDASQIYSSVNFIGGTRTKNNRIIFSSDKSNQVKPGYYIKTESGYSVIDSVNKYVDDPKIDQTTDKIVGFNDFEYLSVVNIKDIFARINLGSDQSFNVYESPYLNIGVFTFFDTKEFDFDFWSSDYSYSPNPETYKYFDIQPGVSGSIKANVPYFVKSGQISYGNSIYNDGDIFYGITGYTSFQISDPSLNLPVLEYSPKTDVNKNQSIGSVQSSSNVIVFPAQYSNNTYSSSSSNYGTISYEKDMESFNGFIGIQGVLLDPLPNNPTKEQIFNYGKLSTEYNYLRENYTVERANMSRIVPYINKWTSSIGTDSRGNRYRLNSSPAFSPTNFSPSFDRQSQDPKYLTHEWFLLESPPRDFQIEFMNNQNSYLPYKIDLEKARSSDPDDYLYLSSYFTVEPEDYQLDLRDPKVYTKELFTNFLYSESSGFYETIFRGVKIVLKKRSDVPRTGTYQSDRYVSGYRGYEDYKFAAILRAIPEDTSIIQAPVKYEVIENETQKFVLFVCDLVVKDQRAFELGYTGGTGGNPILDYTILYSMKNKEKLTYPFLDGYSFNSIDDIKLSSALDLSLASGSYVNTNSYPGIINIYPNPEYDTDLREEIHEIFVENAAGATSGISSTGNGSFYSVVSGYYNTYPWPTGVGPSFVEFGKVATGSGYTFNIPYSLSSPVTVPVGPQSIYKDSPVIQKSGGKSYYENILKRCSVSYISDRVNRSSPYIGYKSYDIDENTGSPVFSINSFELYFEKPTKITKTRGSLVRKSYNGPQLLKGSQIETSYQIVSGLPDYPSIMTRYSGFYEPLFRKVIHFDRDKNDSISGDSLIDLSFRNCNFAPDKFYFGRSRNLSYTKVSGGQNILSAANSFPEGPSYPLIGLSPIDKKDFNLFQSSWDPGYYNKYITSINQSPVAGTRSMVEYKTFFGSKVMQTPDPIQIPNYITLEISRTSGDNSVVNINNQISGYLTPVQNITKSNSATGIGSVGPYKSGVDYDKLNPDIFPDAEVFWQTFEDQRKIKGIIRLDRMLRRYLLNSGIKKVFIDNMISEFGVGDPLSINDDINNYIDLNVSPLYQGQNLYLYVKKVSNTVIPTIEIVRGDIFSSDRYKMEYFIDQNYKLTKLNNLTFSFEFNTEREFYYSLMFNFTISKI